LHVPASNWRDKQRQYVKNEEAAEIVSPRSSHCLKNRLIVIWHFVEFPNADKTVYQMG